jgi:hypothetical protein
MTTTAPLPLPLGPNEVLVTRDVVTMEEQRVLVDWTIDRLREGHLLGNPRDPYSYCTPYLSSNDGALTPLTAASKSEGADTNELVWIPDAASDTVGPLPEAFWTIRARVVRLLEIESLDEDVYKGSFLNCIVGGGKVHQHRDERLRFGRQESAVLRCNVLFNRPENGGTPVIAGTEIDIPDRGMWTFYATELVHAATEVQGATVRGTLSFGFVVPVSALWERRFRVTACAPASLLEQLGRHSDADRIGDGRMAMLRSVLSHQGDFSAAELAGRLDKDASDVWEVVRQLQCVHMVESASTVHQGRGTLIVF